MKVERLTQKLTIMSFIGNFFDTYHHLQPVSFSSVFHPVISGSYALHPFISPFYFIAAIECHNCCFQIHTQLHQNEEAAGGMGTLFYQVMSQ